MIKDDQPIHYDFSDKPIVDDWPWEVKPIAFRVAAGILLANLLISAAGLLIGQIPNVITTVIDLALAVGLFLLRPGARGFALFRAYAGAILGPIVIFWRADFMTAIIMSFLQLCYCGALILLLQGKTKNWKVITAIGIFGVFYLGITLCLFSVIILAKANLK